ncbi:MAG: 50S ribosomal protein L18e [Candidatus Marsarchaeota archaeon]|nr:50S ribosomal protein L18e [Candidatus Marsarchaeota archaeon]
MIIGSDNPEFLKLLAFLEKKARKEKSGLWKRVVELLKKPRRRRVEVNLYKIGMFESEFIIVPGKVLGVGDAGKKTIGALSFSSAARKRIEEGGGKALSLTDFAEKVKSKNIMIVV